MYTKAVLLAMLLAVAGAAAQPTPAPEVEEDAGAGLGLIEVAEGAGLTTLVELVKTLPIETQELVANGTYTVLAPNNKAFKKLIKALGGMPNQETIDAVLAYHVIPGALTAADLTDGEKLATLLDEDVTVEIDGADVFFVGADGGKAKVVKADVEAGDSVVHVIDAVLLPTLGSAPAPAPAPSGAATTLASVAALAGSLLAAVLLA